MEQVAASLDEEPCRDHDNEFQKVLETLPKERLWYDDLYLYQGFWCRSRFMEPVISFLKHFQASDSDVILATHPKSGTTWIKALTFSILNRTRYTLQDNPLLTSNPHRLVPTSVPSLYIKSESPDISARIVATHVPYQPLPPSIKDSNCRIVYVCRNPLDLLISYWHFAHKFSHRNREPVSIDEDFDNFCRGVHAFGPFADHVLGYWKASLDRPEKVLFLKYEDMKQDVHSVVKRLADFLGCPFSAEEEKQGVVQDICGLCSYESLKNLEVNKTGTDVFGTPHSAFFREGKVGGWEDHLSPSQAKYLENLVEEKLRGSGLTFKTSAQPGKDDV